MFFPSIYGINMKLAGHKSRSAEAKKPRIHITYSTERKDEFSNIFIISLLCVWRIRERFLSRGTASNFSFKLTYVKSKKRLLEIVVKSLAHFNAQFKIRKKGLSFACYESWEYSVINRETATKTALNISEQWYRKRPINWQITARVITEMYNNRSYYCF